MKITWVKQKLDELDEPIPQGSIGWDLFRKGKIRIVIIYEDRSFKEYYVKFKESYRITVKNRIYIIVPSCVIYGKNNTLVYFFNNPFPINFDYQPSKLKSGKLADKMGKTAIDITLDAEALKAAFESNIVKKMYSEGGGTFKQYITIVIIVLIVILVLLHVFGVIDIFSFLTGYNK